MLWKNVFILSTRSKYSLVWNSIQIVKFDTLFFNSKSCISFTFSGFWRTSSFFSPPQSTRDNAMRLFSFLLSCVVAARWFQPAGFRSGLSAAHMPTHREDRKAAGSQPPAAEADLQPAEERQDDQDQRGARSFLPLLVMVVGVQCTLYSYSYFHCSRLPPIRVWVPITTHFRCKKGKISNRVQREEVTGPSTLLKGSRMSSSHIL